MTMVGRVAKALYDKSRADGNMTEWCLDSLSMEGAEIYARAAIEATDRAELLALLRRCREAGCINPFNENAELAEDIDAALK